MKIDKEYPATHSMSTSWYIVDDEGNVGIIDYNENGPVPWGVEQTSGDDLKYGHSEDRTFLRFNLTDEQILDLLHAPHSPLESTDWFNGVVKIDKSKVSRFLELCKHKDIDKNEPFCISEELGLYWIDASDCVLDIDGKEMPVRGTLKTMIDENLIIEVYDVQSLYTCDNYQDGMVFHVKEFDNSPYYMYNQPYWPDFLPQKTHDPMHPVTIDQIPENFRHRLHRIPGKFKEMDTFQIAQYYPCNAYSNGDPTYIIDGCSYQTSPLPDGSKVYTMTGMYEYSFFPFCSEKSRFHCSSKCSPSCCNIEDMLITDQPTVLLIFDPKDRDKYEWVVRTDIVWQKAYITSYIPKFPYRKGQDEWCSKSDVEKFMTEDYLTKVLRGSTGYIETIVNDMRPRVILATDKAYNVISKVYSITRDKIQMNGVEYPFFKLSSLKSHRAEVEELAKMEYRGMHHPKVISMEDMNKLVEKGIAKEYKDL